jgi:hypothetical protein
MKCPKDNKQYIIPTKKWLTPIKPLLLEDINTSGLIMVAKLIEKLTILVYLIFVAAIEAMQSLMP